MEQKNYRSSSHCKYLIQYHIIWCPKFRYPVLTAGREQKLKEILSDIAREYNYEIRAMEVMPDHIHLFLSTPHTVSPDAVVRSLKSISAIRMFKSDPALRQHYKRSGHLWSRGYYIATVGTVSAETVRNYIENQKQEGRKHTCTIRKRSQRS